MIGLVLSMALAPPTYQELVHLFDYDPAALLQIREVGVEQRGDVVIHDISYASPKGGRTAAFLLLPPGRGPFPAILFQHGGFGNRAQLLPGALRLAHAGAVCLLINGATNRDREPPPRVVLADPEHLRAEIIQNVVDLRRGIDLLTARPDVAPDRLAYVGWSAGAMIGGILAGVDHRVKAFDLISGAARMAEVYRRSQDKIMLETRQTLGPEQFEKNLAVLEDVESIHYIGHAAPAVVRFENGRRDTAVPEALGRQYQEAGSEPKEMEWYDAGHMLVDLPAAFTDRARWLGRQIGVGPVE